jgi:hypothetical protein
VTLTQAIEIARRTMEEHGGIEMTIVDLRPRMTAINPDNPEQVQCAEAYNLLSAASLLR